MSKIFENYTGDVTLELKKLAERPRILDQLEEVVQGQGFAGSADIPKLVYLVLLTGVFDRPSSLLIKGPSGAGKSYSLNMGRQFVPETAYEQFEGMTEKSLIYHTDLDLRNKHVIIGEAAGSADGNGNAFLRQLLSEGQIRYSTTQSTNEGLKGVTIEVEGPTGLIMTTTAGRIHAEDESRMISVSVTESPDQIRAALLAQAVGSQAPVEEINLQPWHDLYEVYRSAPKEVIIPYAGKIAEALPTSHDRIKRDFPQVLNLITAHALLHSCSRERTGNGVLIATRDDYDVVYGLVNDALSEGLEVTVSEPVRQVVEAVKDLAQKPSTSITVSQAEIVQHLGRDRAVISRNVGRAIELGYLTDETPGQGRTSSLRLGEVELPSNKVLPLPEELFAEEATSVPEMV
ncbi:helix-turn-helix domain-containing protein [Labrenzia sp. VG12]|uniref:MarR family transcriptional regulator n=1 Tax=Labrenzia sp. VG12 TaxID=2021862 RepID=UPI000B8C4443|nr:helix-turn-helix domain-containing protein [Labrenzia sp. VG12]ASP32240.1 hypothetical protein CHH27_02445 [Labrenzia sp. VG12]